MARKLKTITLRGKEYPLRVTMGAMLRYKRLTGNDVSRMEKGDVCSLIEFTWCCVASACAADGVEFGYSIEEFADLLDPGVLVAMEGENHAEKKSQASA